MIRNESVIASQLIISSTGISCGKMGFKSLNKYILLFWLVLYLRKISCLNEFCPAYCKCYVWDTDMRRADCINQNLLNIETEVDKNVEVLDLSNNSITALANNGFQSLRLTNLKYILLQNNKISSIDLHAFSGLKDLQKLDISYNHLNYLLPGIFYDTPNLRSLHLSHNKLAKFSAGPLLIIPNLRELDISSCQLGNILEDYFSQLPAIRRLNLSDNQLTRLEAKILAPLIDIREIDLTNNPWACDLVKIELLPWLHKQEMKDTTNCVKEDHKFERIITASNKTESESMEDDIQTFWFEKDDKEDLEDRVNIVVVNPSESDGLFDMIERIPSVWAMLIGFEVGVVISVLGMYIWLKNSAPERRVRSFRPTSQSSEMLWTELDSDLPPETPPPPYNPNRNRSLYQQQYHQ